MISLIILLSVSINLSDNLTGNWDAKRSPINRAPHQLFGGEKQFDSLNVRFVGNWPFGLSYAVAYDSINQRVFLGSGTGVYVLDVSTPTNPIKLSEKLHDRFVPLKMFYSNNLLYIASSLDGEFNIWDVNNIFSPIKIGEINICPFNDIEIFGNYTYTVGNDSLRIIDISTPSNPQEISSYPLPQGKGVAVAGNYAYVGAGNRDLRIIDISNPSNPQEIGSYEDSATTNATDVVVSGNYAYVCAPMAVFGELWVMDISNPSNPQRIAVLNKIITKFKISGNYLYAFEDSYFTIYDISNPVNPQLVGSLSSLLFNGSPWDMEFFGNYAYIASNIGGLTIVNISDPSNPFVIGHYDNPDATEDIVIVGNYAYVANFRGGLRIIDISTPSDPMEIGFCYTPQAMGLAVSGGYAYISNGFSPVSIIDISTPSNPTMVAQYQQQQQGYSWNLAVSGNYLYVACLFDNEEGSLEIVDVSTPSNPQAVSYYNIPYYIEDVAVAGNYAYIPAMDSGFYVIDISNPSNPVQIGHLQWNGTMLFLVLSDSFAYVVTQDTSLCVKVVNVANPSNPWIVGSFAAFPGVSARGIGIFQNYVYMDAAPCTLYVIDVSIPSNPQLAGFYRPVFPCWNYHIGTSGRYIYASNWGTGMEVYENLLVGVEEENSKIKVQKPKLQIYPNPLVHCATVALNQVQGRLPLESKVLFRIYDISGKLVKEVSPGNVCSGKHKIYVDDLPSGVYFLQLEGDKKLNHKFIVIGTGK